MEDNSLIRLSSHEKTPSSVTQIQDPRVPQADFWDQLNLEKFRAGQDEHIRGRQTISPDEASHRAHKLLPIDDPGIHWGGLTLPFDKSVTHFCAIGAPGSGKTMLLRLMMQSVLPLIGQPTKRAPRSKFEKDIQEYRSKIKNLDGLLNEAKEEEKIFLEPFGEIINWNHARRALGKIQSAIFNQHQEKFNGETLRNYREIKSKEYGLATHEATLKHLLADINPHNPNSRARYKADIEVLEKEIEKLSKKIEDEFGLLEYQERISAAQFKDAKAKEYGYAGVADLEKHLAEIDHQFIRTYFSSGGWDAIEAACARFSIAMHYDSDGSRTLYESQKQRVHESEQQYAAPENVAQQNSWRLRYFADAIQHALPMDSIGKKAEQLSQQVATLEEEKSAVRNQKLEEYVIRGLDPEPTPDVHPGHRAFIYDPKGDMNSLLHGMKKIGLNCPIILLNPFDKRSHAWDLAADFNEPAAAERLSAILIPETKNASQPFFSNAARDLFTAVMTVFIRIKPGKWTLRDVLLALSSKQRIIETLNKTPQTEDLVDNYFSEERSASNIMAEIRTHTSKYRIVAALWHKAGDKKISLEHWLKNEYILVLGRSKKYGSSLDPINRAIFERVSDIILSPEHPDSKTRRTWFFLDEIRNAGNLESLGPLLTEGRSRGVSAVLGFQSVAGMHDAFTKEKATEIIGLCAQKVFLRVDDFETAKYQSEQIGRKESLEYEVGINQGSSTNSGETITHGESRGLTKTTGTTAGVTTGRTDGTTIGDTTGITSGTSDGVTQGISIGTSSGKTYGPSFSHNLGQSWQQSDQRSLQNSSQNSEQTSRQSSTQLSVQNSEQTSNSDALQISSNSSTAQNNSSGTSQAVTINRKRMEKDVVLPSEIMALPETNPANGLHAFYLVPCIGALFHGVVPGETLQQALVPHALEPEYKNYEGRPPEDQDLLAWDEKELAELGLMSGAKKASSEETPVDSSIAPRKEKSPGSIRNIRVRFLPGSDPENGFTLG